MLAHYAIRIEPRDTALELFHYAFCLRAEDAVGAEVIAPGGNRHPKAEVQQCHLDKVDVASTSAAPDRLAPGGNGIEVSFLAKARRR
jgi:hypothetical protein